MADEKSKGNAANASAGDTADGGAGAGGSQGAGDDAGGDADDTPVFSQKQTAFLAETIAKTVNSALTNHMKRQPRPQTAEEIAQLVEQRTAAALEKLNKPNKKQPENDESAAELVSLRKQIDDLTKAQKAAEERAKSAELQRQTEKHNQILSQTLEAGGVTGARKRAAIALLREEGRVRADDDGDLVYVDGDDTLPIDKGISKFLASNDGKEFLPGTGAGGGGTKPGKTPTGKNGTSESDKRQSVIGAWIGGQETDA